MANTTKKRTRKFRATLARVKHHFTEARFARKQTARPKTIKTED